MKFRTLVLSVLFCALAVVSVRAQGLDQPRGGIIEGAVVQIGRGRMVQEMGGGNGGAWGRDPVHLVARRWSTFRDVKAPNMLARFFGRGLSPSDQAEIALQKQCLAYRDTYIDLGRKDQGAAEEFADRIAAMLPCGRKVYEAETHNLITSAGEDALSDIIGKVSSPPAQFNYIALTNTGITPAKGDTTLSGEIGSNGLQRAQGTHTNTSAAIGTPPTPNSPTIIGTTGAATLYYWVFACTYQGCTAVGSSSNTTTANATLSTANYVSVTWTGKLGASHYVVIRTQGSGAPSGTISGGASQATTGQVSNNAFCTPLVAGTAPTCTIFDQSNTTIAGTFGPNGTSTTLPASDQTYAGSHTLAKTFTATGTQSAQAFGIFNASSNGTMLAEGTFTSASLVTNDTLTLTWTMYH